MTSRKNAQRLIVSLALPLLAWIYLAGGCGNDLGIEIGGVIAEEISFAVGFELTGEPVCQGPSSRCGPPGIFALIVPDCPLGVVCFGDACNKHDRCYAACGNSKFECDVLFLENLLSVCHEQRGVDDENTDRCNTLAYIYWQVVVRFGQLAFDISQNVNCACLGIPRNRDAAATGRSVYQGKPVYRQFSIAPPQFFPFDDVDDDLMPDAWEREVGLDTENAADAREDPDSDGILNLEEFILGSDPFAADRYYPRRDGE